MNTNQFQPVKDGARRKVRGLWRRNDSYYLQTTVKDPTTGLKKVTKIPLPTASDVASAKLAMAEVLKRVKDGETVHGKSGPPFGEFVKHYISTAMKKPKTISNEQWFLNRWGNYLGIETRLGAITTQQVLSFRNKLKDEGYSPRTINLHMVSLRNLFRLAKTVGYVKTLPTDGIIQMKIEHSPRKLITIEQIDSISNEAITNHKRNGQQFSDFIRLLAFSGGRTSEVLKLTWFDVDFDNKQLIFKGTDTKNSRTRYVSFNSRLKDHLDDMKKRKTSNVLFPSSRTENTVTSFKTILRAIRKKLELPYLTNHLFRHYFISTCVMNQIDFMTIANWAGHKDGGVLIGKTYGHLNQEHIERMADKLTF